ncbi:DUF3102 domain-containing protein [Thalassobius sp. Cn5-15]|uniref:DUF3102 domain-containing protein n=1 Tax=Thalassobius sp. Cn5-15 TaxID=2917763 RepID=UPI001EF2C1F3|nr:DUF3102 domain-containing protein [Thalassobius sp. Cn5-15]MCG7494714.1 DUF3102 domain-containing protein [Thalassobius sp. Cn5-15]
MNHATAVSETKQPFPLHANNVALTETARLAVPVNSKHREVQRLGRTAKEIAAEIGEELIKVKAGLKHGEFMPWVKAECSFGRQTAQDCIAVAKAKYQHAGNCDRCDSIRDVLTLGKTPKPPPQQTRAATLNDLRKVERLRALRDDPSASEGERENAQRKLNEIEKEIGKVEPCVAEAKQKVVHTDLAKQAVEIVMSGVFENPTALDLIQYALMQTYGDDEGRLKRLVDVLKSYKAN